MWQEPGASPVLFQTLVCAVTFNQLRMWLVLNVLCIYVQCGKQKINKCGNYPGNTIVGTSPGIFLCSYNHVVALILQCTQDPNQCLLTALASPPSLLF